MWVEGGAAASAGAAGAFPWHRDETGSGVHLASGPSSPERFQAVLETVVRIYPKCGEAVVFRSPPKFWVNPDTGEVVPYQSGSQEGGQGSNWSKLDVEQRGNENRRRCASRSVGQVRRYCVENRLTKLWVGTYRGEGVHGPEGYRQCMRDGKRLVRRLRKEVFRGRPFPYVISPELHPGGHGWHLNVVLQDVFIDKRQFDRMWGQGNTAYVDFTRDTHDWKGEPIRQEPGAGSGPEAKPGRTGARAARTAAAYVSKYIAKDYGEDQGELIPPGAHRYEVAEGFQPGYVDQRVETRGQGVMVVSDHPSCGSVAYVGWSEDWVDYSGPPVAVVRFDPPATVKRKRRKPPPRS